MNLSRVQVYAPRLEAMDEDHEQFYAELQENVQEISNGDLLIVIGDLDAKEGSLI